MHHNPKASVAFYRMQLEEALLQQTIDAQALLHLSQTLDTKINHALRVRTRPIRRRMLRAVRRRINRALP